MLVCSTWGRKTVSQQPPLATLPLLWHVNSQPCAAASSRHSDVARLVRHCRMALKL